MFVLPTFSLGVVASSSQPAAFSNQFAGSFSFDGTDEHMKCADNFETLFRSSFSVSFWVKFNSIGGAQVVLGSANATSFDRIQIFHDGSTLVHFYEANNVSTTAKNAGSGITWTDWNHVAVTYEQSGSSCNHVLYVNGVAKANGTNTLDMSTYATTGTAPQNLAWAAKTLGTSFVNFADVKLDEMAFFSSVLSATDVSAIYGTPVPGPSDLSSFSPAHWWRMGDISGGSGTTIADQGSGSGSPQSVVDGELENGASYTRITPPYNNNFSLDFDGLDDYVDCGGASTFSFTDGSGNDSPFSISAWVKMDNINRARLVSKDTSTSSREYLFGTNNSNKFNMLLGTSTVNLDIQNNTTLNTSDWFHVVATYDGSKSASGLKVFVNADASSLTDNSAGTYAGMSLTGGSLEIGRFANGHSFFNGLVDEVAIFNSELSASDVTLIYNNGQPFDISSLNPLSFWRMGDNDSGTGTTVTDQGSAGKNGTLTNGPTFSSTVPS